LTDSIHFVFNLFTYLSFSDYLKRFYQRITPSNDVAFMSDELNTTWKIMKEIRRLYVSPMIHTGYCRQVDDVAGCLCPCLDVCREQLLALNLDHLRNVIDI